MDVADVGKGVSVVSGVILALITLADVFFTIYHTDLDGPIAERCQQLIWRLFFGVGRRSGRWRRTVFSLAGPTIVFLTHAVWITLLIFSFAFIFWPYMNTSFQSLPTGKAFTFIDAIYFSGVTGTVLGYGDITPISGPMKIVSFIQSALGFVILTGIVAYLLNLVTSTAERNAFLLRVRTLTAGREEGVEMILRHYAADDPSLLTERLDRLSDSVWGLMQRLQQFPVLGLFQRSLNPEKDPEPVLRILAEICVAGRLLAAGLPNQTQSLRIQVSTDHLDDGLTHVFKALGRTHISKSQAELIERGDPEDIDYQAVQRVLDRIASEIEGWSVTAQVRNELKRCAKIECRSRIVLMHFDSITGWMTDHPIRDLSRS